MLTQSQLEEVIGASGFAERLTRRAGMIAAAVEEDSVVQAKVGLGVEASTPMEAGSVTKGFTGLLLAEALRRGEVALDARVDEVVVGERWEGERPITLLDLATHTSGLPRLSISAARGVLGDPYDGIDRAHVVDWLREHRPQAPAEPVFAYSNFGYAVLGVALEKAAGRRYDDLLRERLLTPLELGATALQLSGGPTLVERGFNPMGMHVRPWHFDAYAPCGALVSTADDLVKAMQGWMDPANPVAALMERALEPQREATGGSIGLAWLTPASGLWSWHNGATLGYSSYVGFSVRRRCGAVLLANQFRAQELTKLGHELMSRLTA